MRIDIYHHFPAGSGSADLKLDQIIAQLKTLGVSIMTVSDAVKKLAVDLDVETNDISARIDALTKKISEGTVDQADIDALNAISDRLKVLGQDPNNPIPPAA